MQTPIFRGYITKKSVKSYDSTLFYWCTSRTHIRTFLRFYGFPKSDRFRTFLDNGMLFRLPNGLAVEPALIRKKFLKWQDAHPEFPRIVFHGLRHSSATYQLMISDGDVKAVQGTTGHASAICW